MDRAEGIVEGRSEAGHRQVPSRRQVIGRSSCFGPSLAVHEAGRRQVVGMRSCLGPSLAVCGGRQVISMSSCLGPSLVAMYVRVSMYSGPAVSIRAHSMAFGLTAWLWLAAAAGRSLRPVGPRSWPRATMAARRKKTTTARRSIPQRSPPGRGEELAQPRPGPTCIHFLMV